MSYFFNKNSIIIALVLMIILFYFVWDPQESIFFPKCIVYSTSGVLCPACGGQRAIHSILHLDITSAMRYNWFVTILLPYFILLIVFEYTSLKNRYKKLYENLFNMRVYSAIIVVMIIFTIVRNL